MFGRRSVPTIMALLAVVATGCSEPSTSLLGEWFGEDYTGTKIRLRFRLDQTLEIVESDSRSVLPDGARLEYATVSEVAPKQLYLKFYNDDELLQKVPFAIYKFENGKLVLCQAVELQQTLGGLPIGKPRFEFPTEFTGDCYALARM